MTLTLIIHDSVTLTNYDLDILDEVDTPSSVVQFNIIAHLHDLSVTLVDNNSKIAEMHIRGR